jgi:hypothetical protein
MPTLCLFSSYFEQAVMPNYVRTYLEELANYADELWFLTNEKELDHKDIRYLTESDIRFRYYPNQGYDFGQWYRAFQEINIGEFDQLILANDSCILFRPLKDFMDWYNDSGLDYAGINDTMEVSYHPQSFFLVIGGKALPFVADYFAHTKIITGGVDKVILSYEIGLPQYLLANGLKVGAMISCEQLARQSNIHPDVFNPSLRAVTRLIVVGSPLVKRRFLMGDFKKNELYSYLTDENFLFPSQLRHFINNKNEENNFLISSFSSLLSRYNNRKRVNSLADDIVSEATRRNSTTEILCLIEYGYWPMGWLSLLKFAWKTKKFRCVVDGIYWTKQRLFAQ